MTVQHFIPERSIIACLRDAERLVKVPFEVTLRPGETQESLLRRFLKTVQVSGILREFKSHQRFVSKRDAYLIKAKNNAKRKRRQNR